MSGELARLFETLEQQFQLPGGYLARTAQLESAMNPNARNPNARVGGAEITLNAGSEGMTAGAFAQQWIDKFNQGSGGRMTGQPLGEMLAGNTGMQQNTAAAAAGGAQPTAAGAAAPAGNRRGMGSVLGDLMASMQPPAQQLTQPQLQQPTQPAQMRGPDLASILGDPRGPLYLRA